MKSVELVPIIIQSVRAQQIRITVNPSFMNSENNGKLTRGRRVFFPSPCRTWVGTRSQQRKPRTNNKPREREREDFRHHALVPFQEFCVDLFQPSGAGKKKKRRRRDTYGDEEEIRTIGSARPLVKRNNFFPVASTSNSGKQESTKFKDNVGVTVYLPGGTMMARHSPYLTWFHVICRTVNLVIVVTFSADKTHIFMFCVMPESDMLRRGSLERLLFTKDPIFFRGIFRGPASILPVSSPFLSVPPPALA